MPYMDGGLGRRVRQHRLRLGITSAGALASLCGVKPNAIYDIERGKTRDPRSSTLSTMAAIFGVTEEHLLHGAPAPSPSVAPAPSPSVAPAPREGAAIASLHGLADAMLECATKQQWIAMIHMWSESVSAHKRR